MYYQGFMKEKASKIQGNPGKMQDDMGFKTAPEVKRAPI
jgi:hypothetical protein